MEIPTHLTDGAFDKLISRGAIIHFRCRFVEDGGSSSPKNKFAVILNTTCPDEPMLFALTTSNVAYYETTTRHDADIIRVPTGTYTFFTKDTVINFRQIHQENLSELRKQYANKELRIIGALLKVHLDRTNEIIAKSLQIEGWKKKRCMTS